MMMVSSSFFLLLEGDRHLLSFFSRVFGVLFTTDNDFLLFRSQKAYAFFLTFDDGLPSSLLKFLLWFSLKHPIRRLLYWERDAFWDTANGCFGNFIYWHNSLNIIHCWVFSCWTCSSSREFIITMIPS
jgi:hypothetical protein